jgi:opacity protein-like surface antigen
MMNGVSRALLAAALLLPALSQAQQQQTTRPPSSQFNYSYVEISYDETEIGANIDGDGLTLSGSFEINDEWHAFASFGNADYDFGFDVDTWALGAGYVFPLQDDIDLYGRVLYIDTEADGPGGGGGDDDGLGLQFRIRALVTDELELEGGIQYVDVGDNDTSLQAGARYYFSEQLSAGVGLTFGGDTDGIGINARYSF